MGNLPSLVVYQSILEKIEHSALLYVGFQQLVHAGVARFRIQSMPKEIGKLVGGDDLVVCGAYRSASDATEIRFAVDLRDRNDKVNEALFSWADVYFKRSILLGQAASTDSKLQKKVTFYGLNFAARDNLFAKDSIELLKNLISWPLSLSMARIRMYVSLSALSGFEQSAYTPLANKILFQTRVWTASDVPAGNSEALNEKRVTLVRELRNHFGPTFQGGLVPTPLALSRYPDFISPLPSKRGLFAKSAKQNLIGVYSEGLSDSTAFKFLEYLAGSQCIVAEKISNQLPPSCEEGKNYLSFQSPAECIAACERLLTSAADAQEMRLANEGLYQDFASPRARARKMLAILDSAIVNKST
jgi:hypothetical protein